MSGLKVVRERALWRPAVLPALKSILGAKAAVPEFRQLLPDQAVPVWNSFGRIGQFDVKVELTELELEDDITPLLRDPKLWDAVQAPRVDNPIDAVAASWQERYDRACRTAIGRRAEMLPSPWVGGFGLGRAQIDRTLTVLELAERQPELLPGLRRATLGAVAELVLMTEHQHGTLVRTLPCGRKVRGRAVPVLTARTGNEWLTTRNFAERAEKILGPGGSRSDRWYLTWSSDLGWQPSALRGTDVMEEPLQISPRA